MIELSPEVTLEMQLAWRRVQEAHSAYAEADTAHIDGSIYRLMAAQADYDVLVEEHLGITPLSRRKMLKDMQRIGLQPEIFIAR